MVKKTIVTIRTAELSDAATLATLAGELGYPATTAEMKRRLELLRNNGHHEIFVAECGTLLGWIHVSLVETLETESFAEIRGLIVTEAQRGSGIGAKLVAKAEHWAGTKECNRIRVRTNIVRAEAHSFYKKLGYISKKTQDVFDKVLPSGA